MSFEQIARGIYGMRDGVMRGDSAGPAAHADAGGTSSLAQAGGFPTASSRAAAGLPLHVIGDHASAADVAQFLSPASAEVLRGLEDEAHAKHVVIRDLSDRRRELIEARGRQEIALQDLDRHKSNPGYAEAVADRSRKVAEANEEIARINARSESMRPIWEASKRLSDRLTRYVASLVANMPRDIETDAEGGLADEGPLLPSIDLPTFTLRKGELLADAVEAKRRRVRELIADRERARVAPIHSDKAKAIALADIEARAEAAKPDCLNLIEYGEPIDWAKTPLEKVFTYGVPGVLGKIPDSIGLMALMFKERLVSVVNAQIDEMANDAEALTDDQRAEVIAACTRDLYAVQLEEEAMIRAGTEQGVVIQRREDADPRAVLALPGDLPQMRQ